MSKSEPRLGSLWRNPEFLKLWAGHSVSYLGSQVTLLALPLTAVLLLNATPVQMGILNAAEFVPFLVVALFAGVWVDRHRRRPILIAADVGRALLVGTLGLTLGWLWVLCSPVSRLRQLPTIPVELELVEMAIGGAST